MTTEAKAEPGGNIFDDAIKRLDRAFEFAAIDREAVERLKHPKAIVQVAIPVRMDDGSLRIFEGYRVRHDDSTGTGQGGHPLSPGREPPRSQGPGLLDDLQVRGRGHSLRGRQGGRGGQSEGTVQARAGAPVPGLHPSDREFIGPETDIPAPDVYTNAMIMGWMMDEYSKMQGQRTPAVITGKPIPLGGSLGREDATGRGAYYCIKELERRKGWDPAQVRVAVQGFGNAGQHVARLLHEDGYRVVAVSDSKGGIFKEDGFDIPSLIRFKNESRQLKAVYCDGSVCEMVDAATISNEELLEPRCGCSHPGGPRERDHRGKCRQGEGAGDRRGGQRPHDERRGCGPERSREARRAGHPCQCRRGDRELLRVGPEQAGLLLDGTTGARRG